MTPEQITSKLSLSSLNIVTVVEETDDHPAHIVVGPVFNWLAGFVRIPTKYAPPVLLRISQDVGCADEQLQFSMTVYEWHQLRDFIDAQLEAKGLVNDV